MFRPAGRNISVSRYRRLVVDLMHFSAKVPSVTIERRMELARLVEARKAGTPSPTWSAIFTKAYAIVAKRRPLLRTSYLKFPWPRYYEHPINIATFNIDRQLAQERIVLYAQIASPEECSLRELDAKVRYYREEPIDNILTYRRAVRMSWFPWPVRQFLWWGGLNIFGTLRCHNFGTFGFTSLGAQGAGVLQLLPLLTSTLHYGMFEPSGRLDVRLSFDHRVFDGTTAAEALAELEQVLVGEILEECQANGQVV